MMQKRERKSLTVGPVIFTGLVVFGFFVVYLFADFSKEVEVVGDGKTISNLRTRGAGLSGKRVMTRDFEGQADSYFSAISKVEKGLSSEEDGFGIDGIGDYDSEGYADVGGEKQELKKTIASVLLEAVKSIGLPGPGVAGVESGFSEEVSDIDGELDELGSEIPSVFWGERD